MSVASRDFNDDAAEYGPGAVRAALQAAQSQWPPEPPPSLDIADAPVKFAATPFVWRDPITIPRRQFLYGFELKRAQLSAVVAPGAAGKTTLKVGRAVCMASGRDVLGHRVWNGPHRVWLFNLEDEREEIEKAVHAFMKLWQITPAELGDRLLIDGIDNPSAPFFKIATETERGRYVIRRPVVDALVEELKDRGIDYLDVDPFVSSHGVDENSNNAIDLVAKEYLSIARLANCAVSLTHHVRKPNGTEASANDARGAVAMINAARSVLVLQKMTKEAGESLRVPECDRRKYLSVFDDKNNRAPTTIVADWYEFVGIGLGNGDDTGPEDNIGALKRWIPPETFAGVTARHLLAIQEAIDREPEKARKYSSSGGWVGLLVAPILDLDPDDPGEKQAIKKMVQTWVNTGALRFVTRGDTNSNKREYLEVGEWAIVE